LQEWVKDKKKVILPDEVLEKAISELDGRPLLLRTWIDNDDFSLESFDQPWDKTYGFHDQLFSHLHENSQKIAILLSHIPLSFTLSTEIISRITEIPAIDLNTLLLELSKYKFLLKDGTNYRYSHQLIRNFVRENKSSLTKESLIKILGIFETEFGHITVSASPAELIETKLELTVSIDNIETFKFYDEISRKQLDEGAYQSAISIVETAMDRANGLAISNDDKVNILLIKYKALEQLGEYEPGITDLASYDISKLSEAIQCLAYKLLAELNLRLNHYKESLANIANAESIFSSLGDNDGLAKVLIIKGHVLRDTEEYEEAENLARYLSSDVLPNINDEAVKAHVHRSIARAQASLFNSDAISNALISKSIAEQIGLRRHIGAAEFTLGEAYRLNKDYNKAEDSYKVGLEIAYSLGNRDLEIYCKLGLTATMISLGDLASENIYLSDLEKLEPAKFPVEAAHAKLLSYIIKLLKDEGVSTELIEEVDSEYRERFSRSLPGEYLKNLQTIPGAASRQEYAADNPVRL
jgi:tetratricopeptide (TPR) repeat protein